MWVLKCHMFVQATIFFCAIPIILPYTYSVIILSGLQFLTATTLHSWNSVSEHFKTFPFHVYKMMRVLFMTTSLGKKFILQMFQPSPSLYHTEEHLVKKVGFLPSAIVRWPRGAIHFANLDPFQTRQFPKLCFYKLDHFWSCTFPKSIILLRCHRAAPMESE